ncbi:hypothetical protein EJ08DRAFT_359916 [Tothia fuscella]|uniref:Uncharacterized protein n=1 Tax=Tothia fuscella TaxID=1048955 RepID=A0A9P4NLY8_9PEZI|nr:hypothetical protein EJ08DRAFT_359916 [Tothia fuscella]
MVALLQRPTSSLSLFTFFYWKAGNESVNTRARWSLSLANSGTRGLVRQAPGFGDRTTGRITLRIQEGKVLRYYMANRMLLQLIQWWKSSLGFMHCYCKAPASLFWI